MLKSDQRRYRRISLSLPARVVINAVDEYEGRLINMSPGDMALIVPAKAVVGDAVVVRIKGLDVIEGTVARKFPDGIAVSFLLSKSRKGLLLEKLMLLANPSFAEGLNDRRAEPRHKVSDSRAICRLDDGTSLFVKVIERSVNGVSVDAPRRPEIGASIMIGSRRGVVSRHTPRGFVAVYDAPGETQKPFSKAI
jgi:hypothetical protein